MSQIKKYIGRTNIKSVEDAKRLHKNLIISFWSFAVYSMVMRGLSMSYDETLQLYGLFLSLLWPIVGATFVTFLVKNLRIIRVADVHAVWGIFFAPISWLWFYPTIVEPLKIIQGKKPVPDELPKQRYNVREPKQKENFYLAKVFTGALILLGMFVAAILAVGFSEVEDYGVVDNEPAGRTAEDLTESTANRSERLASQAVSEIQADSILPQAVDEITTWIDIGSAGNTLQYFYEVEVEGRDAFDVTAVREYLIPSICHEPDLQYFLERDVNLEYIYETWPYGEIYKILLTPADC